ncbi:glycosyltransferase [Methylobacterium sp. Leaf117]|uniref:glycosyltransferase n=1 Tax=Methylobacterium sp. Leaf117 TaxID=1736260 RepID=UPI0009EB4871|nr:glycosyltransferase [Methylobacterium sp. Leaf117]
MKVVWISGLIPLPLTAGDRVYSARFAEAVGAAGANVYLLGLSSGDGPDDADSLGSDVILLPVHTAQRGRPRAVVSRLPIVTARCSPRTIRKRMLCLLAEEEPDVVVIDNYAAGWVLRNLACVPESRFKLVYIAHNDEEQVARDIAQAYRGNTLKKLVLAANALKVAHLERKLLHAADLVVTLTGRDAEMFKPRLAGADVLVVPPGFAGERVAARRIDAAVPRRVVMLGSLRWLPKKMNVAAFLTAADAILASAGVELHLVGDVSAAFRAEWEGQLRATRFLGFVEDAEQVMAQARLGLIVEAVGGGFKLKVLDYIFNRLPVAALEGSFEGVPDAIMDHCLLAGDGAELARKIVDVIDDFPRLNAMQEGSFAAASGTFDWSENGRQFLDVLESLAPAGRYRVSSSASSSAPSSAPSSAGS